MKIKKILTIGCGLAFILSSSNSLTSKKNLNLANNTQTNTSIKYGTEIDISNFTNNVYGGDSYHFGTWFYLDLSINGVVYNDNDFTNITIENDKNAGGAGTSAGRRGDKDVFFTPMKSTTRIFLSSLSNNNKWNLSFTFGTFCWGPIWCPHFELTSFNDTIVATLPSPSTGIVSAIAGIKIIANGTNHNNSAQYEEFWYSNYKNFY